MYQTKDVNGPSYMKSCESKVWLSTGRTLSRLLTIAVMLKLGSQIARKMAAFPVSWRGKSCHFYCKVIPNILTSKLFVITSRKRSLGQGNIFTPVCHSVHKGACVVARGACVVTGGHVWLPGGICGCRGACVVARGMHGCQGACVVSWGGVHGCWGACMVKGVHAWGGMHGEEGSVHGERGCAWWRGCVPGSMHGEGGMHGERGACVARGCMAKGDVCGRGVCVAKGACLVKRGHAWWREHAWWRGHAWWKGGMSGEGCVCVCMVCTPLLWDMAGQCAGGMHPTGMHSCLLW